MTPREKHAAGQFEIAPESAQNMRAMADEVGERPEVRDKKLPQHARAAGFCRAFVY
jgi:hypothetical protein